MSNPPVGKYHTTTNFIYLCVDYKNLFTIVVANNKYIGNNLNGDNNTNEF